MAPAKASWISPRRCLQDAGEADQDRQVDAAQLQPVDQLLQIEPAIGVLGRDGPARARCRRWRSIPFPSGRCRTTRRRRWPSTVGPLDRAWQHTLAANRTQNKLSIVSNYWHQVDVVPCQNFASRPRNLRSTARGGGAHRLVDERAARDNRATSFQCARKVRGHRWRSNHALS